MIFSLNKATSLFTVLSRPNSGWLSTKHHSGKAVPAGQNHQRALAGSGILGLLVSSDAARDRWL